MKIFAGVLTCVEDRNARCQGMCQDTRCLHLRPPVAESGYRYNLPDGRTYQSPFSRRGVIKSKGKGKKVKVRKRLSPPLFQYTSLCPFLIPIFTCQRPILPAGAIIGQLALPRCCAGWKPALRGQAKQALHI